MPDKEKATKLLGFRDDKGALVCPADVVDPSKSYTCHIGAEDGSYTPSADDLKAIGSLLEQVGLKGQTTAEKTKGGTVFYNKKGVVICRIVEGVAPAPVPKKVETKVVEPEKTEPKDTTKEVKDAEVQAKAADAAVVKQTPAKKPAKKKPARQKKPIKRGK